MNNAKVLITAAVIEEKVVSMISVTFLLKSFKTRMLLPNLLAMSLT